MNPNAIDRGVNARLPMIAAAAILVACAPAASPATTDARPHANSAGVATCQVVHQTPWIIPIVGAVTPLAASVSQQVSPVPPCDDPAVIVPTPLPPLSARCPRRDAAHATTTDATGYDTSALACPTQPRP